MIGVLIADDEPLARRGLEQLLASHTDCEIVAQCRNGPETVRALNDAAAAGDWFIPPFPMPSASGS